MLYLEDANSPEKLKKKKSEESNYLRQAYYGYSFESYSTHSMKSTRSPIISSQSPESNSEFSIPNTNVQWCSIIKTNLGGFRTILGGEVDCITPGQEKGGEIDPKHFIELKTNIIIESQRDEIMFER